MLLAVDIHYGVAEFAIADQPDWGAIAALMYWQMMRNVVGHGIGYVDPYDPEVSGLAGCIIASPSYPTDDVSNVDQNYVYNWTRDSAMAATQIAVFGEAAGDARASQRLADYVSFAETCQANSAGDLAHAAYTLDGRSWDGRPDPQNDGPALQTLAILAALPALSSQARTVALQVAQANLDWLSDHAGQPSQNLWEECDGQSFFTLSVQLRCLTSIRDNPRGLSVRPGIDGIIDGLESQLAAHWQEPSSCYCSLTGSANEPSEYDPNADIVMASIYGAVSCTDPKLLASAAAVRDWCQNYPINQADSLSAGPLIGRYPGDRYDGDNSKDTANSTGHPWMLCSANFAELYYAVAASLNQDPAVISDATARPFFDQVGVPIDTAPHAAAEALRNAGDRILTSVIRHSDHLSLSEQVDVNTGYEKSVHNLTWSYAAFLSAVRARGQLPN